MNEAAERLREWDSTGCQYDLPSMLDAALAEERSRVIEQIRERLDELDLMNGDSYNAVLDDIARPDGEGAWAAVFADYRNRLSGSAGDAPEPTE